MQRKSQTTKPRNTWRIGASPGNRNQRKRKKAKENPIPSNEHADKYKGALNLREFLKTANHLPFVLEYT